MMSKSKVTNWNHINSKNIFTIECKDIVLREFQLEDLDAIYNITLQPEIAEFLPDWIATKEKRREWLTQYETKENKEFFESVPNIPNISRHALRLGIILKETNEYKCKWYTTQAAQGLIKYLFENTNTDVLNATALTYNTPLNRVIQKCGFKLVGNIVIENKDYYYYRINKSEWKK